MVQKTRTKVLIGVLSDNVKEFQQQMDKHASSIRLIHAKLDRMETSFANLKTVLEERLPTRQPKPLQPLMR
jgi:uncharacterized coiled-coil protein SlyX